MLAGFMASITFAKTKRWAVSQDQLQKVLCTQVALVDFSVSAAVKRRAQGALSMAHASCPGHVLLVSGSGLRVVCFW